MGFGVEQKYVISQKKYVIARSGPTSCRNTETRWPPCVPGTSFSPRARRPHFRRRRLRPACVRTRARSQWKSDLSAAIEGGRKVAFLGSVRRIVGRERSRRWRHPSSVFGLSEVRFGLLLVLQEEECESLRGRLVVLGNLTLDGQ